MAPIFHSLPPGGSPDHGDYREIRTPEAQELAEIHLLVADLESALHNFNALSERHYDESAPASERAVGEALFRDAITLIAGCLGSKRLPAAEVLKDIPGGMETYEYIRALRDTFAAHNVGPLRQSAMVVKRLPGAIGLQDLRFRLSLPNKSSIAEYIRFIALIVRFAEAKAAPLSAAVRDQVAALTPEEFDALPPVGVRAPTQDEYRLSRAGFRSGGKGRSRGQKG